MTEELRKLAEEFRAAIMRSRKHFPYFLKEKLRAFPKQCCEHASTLMGLYLKEKGFAEAQYVWGVRNPNAWPNDETHGAWRSRTYYR
jgi:hypothetical protein